MERLKTSSELEQVYNDAITTDQKVYDEQKSNVLLRAGYHYANRGSRAFDRIRESSNLTQEQKLRLTINHIGYIMDQYDNNILSLSPGVGIYPKDVNERQDQTRAEMHRSVWEDFKYRYDYKDLVENIVSDFDTIGEVFIKTLFDPSMGSIVGYRQLIDEMGQPVIDPMTGEQVVNQEEPIYAGGYLIDIIPGYDVFRDPNVKDLRESAFIGIRKMVKIKDLKAMIKNDPSFDKREKEEKLEAIKESGEETFSVFNGASNTITSSKDMVMLKEFYYKPCAEYRNGYFYIKVTNTILWHGELQQSASGKPVFPIRYALYDKFQGQARGYSRIKRARPLQVEINRTNSKIAETQITLGDDKLVTYMNGSITEGQKLSGIREIKVVGGAQRPDVIPGRSGDQYLTYNKEKVSELYRIMSVREDFAEKQSGDVDIVASLYKSMKDKKKFSLKAMKIERLLVGWCQDVLDLAKAYYPEEVVVKMVGDSQAVNMPEFKTTDDLSYEIKVEPQSDDVDSVMGKYLTMTHTMQYVGSKLDKQDLGKLLINHPFVNGEQMFGHLARDEKVLKNVLNQLDRGEQVMVSRFDNNEYLLNGIVERMGQADFEVKAAKTPGMKEAYDEQYELRGMKIEEEITKQKSLNQGMIPTGGYLVKCDVYTTDPNKPSKTQRLELPSEALDWVQARLAEQGAYLRIIDEVPLPDNNVISIEGRPPQRGI